MQKERLNFTELKEKRLKHQGEMVNTILVEFRERLVSKICHSHSTVEMSPTSLQTQQDRVTLYFTWNRGRATRRKLRGMRKAGAWVNLYISVEEGMNLQLKCSEALQEVTVQKITLWKEVTQSIRNKLQHT